MTALEVLQVLVGAWAAVCLGSFVLCSTLGRPALWHGDPERLP